MELNIKLTTPEVYYVYCNRDIIFAVCEWKTPLGKIKVTGKAILSKNDKYDEEFGKKLALARAELEAFNTYIRMLENTRKDINLKISEYKTKMRQARSNQAFYINGLRNSSNII